MKSTIQVTIDGVNRMRWDEAEQKIAVSLLREPLLLWVSARAKTLIDQLAASIEDCVWVSIAWSVETHEILDIVFEPELQEELGF